MKTVLSSMPSSSFPLWSLKTSKNGPRAVPLPLRATGLQLFLTTCAHVGSCRSFSGLCFPAWLGTVLHHVWVPLPALVLFLKHSPDVWLITSRDAEICSGGFLILLIPQPLFLRYILYILQRFLCIKGSESLGSFHSFSAPFWLQNWLLLFLQVIYWLIGCFSFCCHLNFMATSWHLSFAQYPCHHFWSWSSSLLQFSFTLTPLNFIKVSFMTCHHSIGVFFSFQFISIVVLCCAFKIAVNSGITSLILFCF